MIITLVFKKNANFFAENWEKSQKIVIITSTPESRYSSMYSEKQIVGNSVEMDSLRNIGKMLSATKLKFERNIPENC
jgi:hypothetical protein